MANQKEDINIFQELNSIQTLYQKTWSSLKKNWYLCQQKTASQPFKGIIIDTERPMKH